jgi:hypothetical protein
MPALRRLRNEDCKSKASWAVKKDVVTHTHTHTHSGKSTSPLMQWKCIKFNNYPGKE